MDAKTKAADFIDVKEAAQILHVSIDSVRRFLWKRKLKRYKVGSGKGGSNRTLVSRTEVLSLIKEV